MFLDLRSGREPTPSGSPHVKSDETVERLQHAEQWYLCKGCLNPIARPKDERIVHGLHVHLFANPSGIVYEFRCFAQAAGCTLVGPESSEFTWFAGHRWRIAVCSACRVHLGWKFTEGLNPGFFGLICDRLTAAPTLRQ